MSLSFSESEKFKQTALRLKMVEASLQIISFSLARQQTALRLKMIETNLEK
jgi:hypothetical protein